MKYLLLIVSLASILFFAVRTFAQKEPIKTTENIEKIIFAGGCFWCMESDFEKLNGVVSVVSGYTGGTKLNPTYEEVSRGETGHAESVLVSFDPNLLSYSQLLNYYWYHVDPTVLNRQFCDIGNQYRTAIFYLDEHQKKLTEESKEKLIRSGRFKRIETQIVAASTFYPAEEYHQDYYKKNPVRYRYYRLRCGRDKRIEELWGKNPEMTMNP